MRECALADSNAITLGEPHIGGDSNFVVYQATPNQFHIPSLWKSQAKS